MKISKLIKILDREEKQRSKGLVTISTEILSDSAFDLKSFLREKFSQALARQQDAELRRILYGEGVTAIPTGLLRGNGFVRAAFEEVGRAKRKVREFSNPMPECPGCGAAFGMELCHCKRGCKCERCSRKKR